MNESQISVRYAKALFQSASEKQILDDVFKDMELLSETWKLNDFQYMMMLPSLQPSQKNKIIEALFQHNISEISISMIHLVIKNKRESYLPGIARNYKDLYRRARDIRTATLVTAQPVDEGAMNRIKELIRKAYQADVEMTSDLDEDIIGGFILTIEDMQYDASVSSNLRKMKKQLLQTTIEKR